MIAGLAILVGVVLILIAGVMWLRPSKRARAKWYQAPGGVLLIGGVIATNVATGQAAREAGFESIDDRGAAQAEGFSDGAAWYAELERREAEEQARVAAARAEERAACRADFTCWGRDRRIEAEIQCKRSIEQQARFDHEWTDDWTQPMFSRFRWKDEGAGVMTYYGDRLRLQNGFGAWANVSYSCDFDTERDVALSVSIQEGRL